jgi:hypothetical protein
MKQHLFLLAALCFTACSALPSFAPTPDAPATETRLASNIYATQTVNALTPVATPTPSDSPEIAAREWLQAIADADGIKLDERTCNLRVKQVQSGTLLPILFGVVGEATKNANPKTDVSALKIELGNANGDTAQVRVTGRIRSGAGASVLSEVIDQTWQITREDGKWKFCGHPLLAARDLPRLVLQPSEVPAFLFEAYDGAQALERMGPQGEELEKAGAINGIYRDYRATQQPRRIYSVVFLFDNVEASRRSLAALRNQFQSPGDGPASTATRTILTPLELGEEELGVSLFNNSDDGHPDGVIIYAWRSANVILLTSFFVDSTDESKIRPFAYKIQSHMYRNSEPELLPTPIRVFPTPTSFFSGTNTVTPTP